MTAQKSTKSFGAYGEQLAADYLEHNAYQIVARNWHCPIGELDIIARQGNLLVFVEVRSRHAGSTETAFESIGAGKRNKLIALAHQYLHDHELLEQDWRIDVIAVAIPASGKPIVEHTEDALDW